jgi:hypothetical protein
VVLFFVVFLTGFGIPHDRTTRISCVCSECIKSVKGAHYPAAG